MTLWDILLLWVLSQLGGREKGPKWPTPGSTGPSGPTGPTGPTGPGMTGPTGPTGAMGGTTWKPYFYIQPDAGAALGTPYALAGEWHGKGTAWTELYNFTQGRAMGQAVSQAAGIRDKALVYHWPVGGTKNHTKVEMRDCPIYITSSGEVWYDAETERHLKDAGAVYRPGELEDTLKAISAKLKAALAGGAAYGSTVSGVVGAEQGTPAYANKGDKLLVPFEWPEPTHAAILARLEPIPVGTVLPGVPSKGVNGDESAETI